MKSFIISQFSYCPLICMTHSRGLNKKMNHIHERALRIFYKDFSTSFEGLLAKDKSVTIHNQNLQQLAIEIFKVKMGISPIVVKEIFNFSDNNNYNLRSGTHLSRLIVHVESITMEQKYGNLYHKILKKQTPCLVLKARLRNGYHKTARVVFVRHI